MSWAAVIIGGVSLVGSGVKYAQGRNQQRRAEQMQPVDPGYQQNQGVIDNARMLKERYGNYRMPGYDQALANLNVGSQQAFSQGVQGATSSADVMDLAARIAYGRSQAQNQLAMNNAQGQDAALMDYLRANAAAGQEQTNANAWERDQFLRQEQRQADLYNAGAINSGQAISEGLNTLGTVASYRMPNMNQQSSSVQPVSQVRGNQIAPLQSSGYQGTPYGGPPVLPQVNVQLPYQNSGNYISPLRFSRMRNVQPIYQLPGR